MASTRNKNTRGDYLEEDKCVNDMLISEDLAVAYTGQSKSSIKTALSEMYNRLKAKGVKL